MVVLTVEWLVDCEPAGTAGVEVAAEVEVSLADYVGEGEEGDGCWGREAQEDVVVPGIMVRVDEKSDCCGEVGVVC